MTEEGNTGLLWEHRLSLWLPRPLFFGGLLVAVSLGIGYLSFQWLFGLDVERAAIGVVLMVAWVLMVPRYLAVSALEGQQAGLDVPVADSHEQEVLALRLPSDKIRVSRFAAVAGVLAIFGVLELNLAIEGVGLVAPWIRLHDSSATMALGLLLGWFFGRGSYFSFDGTYKLPGQRRSDIDLLNLGDLYAIGRSGLRTALVWLVTMSIGGLIVLDSSLGLWGFVSFFAIGLGLGLVALLGPAREVRSLIRAVKRDELARVEPLLRQARDDALTGDMSTQGRLTDLLAYKTQIESTPEWPFDSTTLLRFGLYLLIPVASMVGGALVERVVDVVLD